MISMAMILNAWEARVRLISAAAVSGCLENCIISGGECSEIQIKGSVDEKTSILMSLISLFIQEISQKGYVDKKMISEKVRILEENPIVLIELLEYTNMGFEVRRRYLTKYIDRFLRSELASIRLVLLLSWYTDRKKFSDASVHPLLQSEALSAYVGLARFSFSPMLVRSIGHTNFLFEYIICLEASNIVPLFDYLSPPRQLEAGINANKIVTEMTNKYGGKVHELGSSLESEIYKCAYPGDLALNNLALVKAGRKILTTATKEKEQYHKIPLMKSSYYSFDIINKQKRPQRNYSREVMRFISSDKKLVLLHHRDAGFSGSGQPWRDTPLSEYKETIDMLLEKGYAVVIMNPTTLDKYAAHESILDLSRIEFTLLDQMLLLEKGFCLIGTYSGISHWFTVSGLPALMVNVTAIPGSGINQGILNVPKKIRPNKEFHTLTSKKKEALMRCIFRCTWDGSIHKYLNFESIRGNELRIIVEEFLGSYEDFDNISMWSDEILSRLGVSSEGIPKTLIHSISSNDIVNTFSNSFRGRMN